MWRCVAWFIAASIGDCALILEPSAGFEETFSLQQGHQVKKYLNITNKSNKPTSYSIHSENVYVEEATMVMESTLGMATLSPEELAGMSSHVAARVIDFQHSNGPARVIVQVRDAAQIAEILATDPNQLGSGELRVEGGRRRLDDAVRRRRLATIESMEEVGGVGSVFELANLNVLIVDFAKSSDSTSLEQSINSFFTMEDVLHVEADTMVSIFAEEDDDNFVIGIPTLTPSTTDPIVSVNISLGTVLHSTADANITSVTPNDPLFTQQWNLQFMDLPDAWTLSSGSSVPRPIVAVVDTGVDYNHADLKQNIWVNQAELNGRAGVDDDGDGIVDNIYGWNTDSNSGDPMDDNGHGSHVAGIIGAMGNNRLGLAGVSWGPQILPCKFMNSKGQGAVSNAIRCMSFVIQKGAKIISNSWGGTGTSQALNNAINTARGKGILFVASAGNDGDSNDLVQHLPSNVPLDNVVAVTAVRQDGTIPSFANFGAATVRLAAPGVSITSTWANGTYQLASGTSMACPHVSGLASLMLSYNPTLTYKDILSILQQSVTTSPHFANITTWGGWPNAYRALTLSMGPTWVAPEGGWAKYAKARPLRAGETEAIPMLFQPYSIGLHKANVEVKDIRANVTIVREFKMLVRDPPRLDVSQLPTQPIILPGVIFTSNATISLKNLGQESLEYKILINETKIGNVTLFLDRGIGTLNNISGVGIDTVSVFCSMGASPKPANFHIVIQSKEGMNLTPTNHSVDIFCVPFDFTLSPVAQTGTKGLVKSFSIVIDSNPPKSLPNSLDLQVIASVVPSTVPTQFQKYLPSAPPPIASGSVGISRFVDVRQIFGSRELTALSGGDDARTTVSLERFVLDFYGQRFTNVTVSTNGFLSVSDWDNDYDWNPTLTTPQTPNGVIAPFWSDLNLTSLSVSSVDLYEDDARLIVQWTNLAMYGYPFPSLSFQLIAFASGDISFAYRDGFDPRNSIFQIGVESPSGDSRVTLSVSDRSFAFQNPPVLLRNPSAESFLSVGGFASSLIAMGPVNTSQFPFSVDATATAPDLDSFDLSGEIVFFIGNGFSYEEPLVLATVESQSIQIVHQPNDEDPASTDLIGSIDQPTTTTTTTLLL